MAPRALPLPTAGHVRRDSTGTGLLASLLLPRRQPPPARLISTGMAPRACLPLQPRPRRLPRAPRDNIGTEHLAYLHLRRHQLG